MNYDTNANMKLLAYANLDAYTDDPEEFDTSKLTLSELTVDVYPRVKCFVLTRKETENERYNSTKVFNSFNEASEAFKDCILKHGVTKVAVINGIEDYIEYDDDYDYRCSTYGDYGPSNPWDAPGMSVSDFIRGVY